MHASRTPQRASSSTNARSSRWVSVAAGMMAAMASVPRAASCLLHGFTRDWALRLRTRVGRELDGRTLPAAGARPPRPRRGGGDARGRSTSTSCVADVLALAPGASRCAATRWAGAWRCTSRWPRPSASARLVLVSTSAGIEDDAERAARRDADERAGGRVGSDAVRAGSSTAGAPNRCSPTTLRRSASSPARTGSATTRFMLAARMRGIGTGEMAPLWSDWASSRCR